VTAPEVTDRAYAGKADAERIARVISEFRASNRDDQPPVTARDVESFFFGAAADADPTADVRLFFSDGELIAYERTRRETWADGLRVYNVRPFIHPAHMDPRMITQVVGRIPIYQRDYARHDPLGEGAFLSAMYAPSEILMIDAFLDAGFKQRHFFFQMARALAERPDEPDLPEGVCVLPLNARDYRSISSTGASWVDRGVSRLPVRTTSSGGRRKRSLTLSCGESLGTVTRSWRQRPGRLEERGVRTSEEREARFDSSALHRIGVGEALRLP
jgi:hypothetical protein